MPAAHKSVISFRLVAIPVAMYTTTQDNARIRYKKVCAHCGKEMATADIVKGYEYDKDQFVVVTDDEIEKVKYGKEKSIRILHFALLLRRQGIFVNVSRKMYFCGGGECKLMAVGNVCPNSPCLPITH